MGESRLDWVVDNARRLRFFPEGRSCKGEEGMIFIVSRLIVSGIS